MPDLGIHRLQDSGDAVAAFSGLRAVPRSGADACRAWPTRIMPRWLEARAARRGACVQAQVSAPGPPAQAAGLRLGRKLP